MTTTFQTKTENEYIKYSDFLTIIKEKILSIETISDKFKEYANLNLVIPTRKNLTNMDYFVENNIDTTNICQFLTNLIKHVDLSIGFGSTRGYLALYPNKELSDDDDVQLEEMNDRLNDITTGDLLENKIYLNFLEAFIIADYIRIWMWYGRGMEYSSCLYYNYGTKELYATHINNTVYPVILEEQQFKINDTLSYIINAFYKTIKYKEIYLTDDVLMIPITGMHEAVILNQNALDGYKYNKFTDEDWDKRNEIYQKIITNVHLHYDNNKDELNKEAYKIYGKTDDKVNFYKYKTPLITDLVSEFINIYLDYDKSLDDILISITNNEQELIIISILVNYPDYANHNFDNLFTQALIKL